MAEWCRTRMIEAPTAFDASREIASALGAHPDGPLVRFAFWTPELLDQRVPEGDVFLEVLVPLEEMALAQARQRVRFRRHYLPMVRVEDVCVVAVQGVKAGSRDALGDFYALAWRDREGRWHRILDPMAASLPFGVMAPAEIYDMAALQDARADRAWWQGFAGETPHKFGPVTNILQIHVPTATAGGTLASLAREFDRMSERLRRDLPMEPADELILGYDAVQLLPVEPTTVYETGPDFWVESNLGPDEVTVDLLRPDTTNWGYDVVISGMAAVNPVLLETGRPDELSDLAASLHNFSSGPIRLILDVVFGHADNQGLRALNPHFFAGPNMYGQNLDYRNPRVRAILLEMQRRKVNFGADGVRVDGAQDFRFWDPASEQMLHDDDYLQQMADVEQEVAGTRYRPWFIFEDGRP
ncbi:MAG: hypothetical protein JJU40_08790, partial [Rhodobacteraceae bacterium]|nr:hypothetical protein [Paracoccaceae bacterium]